MTPGTENRYINESSFTFICRQSAWPELQVLVHVDERLFPLPVVCGRVRSSAHEIDSAKCGDCC